MPVTLEVLNELRARIREFSMRIDELRPVLGDELSHEMVQVCDAGVILANFAIPAAQRLAVRDDRVVKLHGQIVRLEDIQRRFRAAEHHVQMAAQAYNDEDFEDDD